MFQGSHKKIGLWAVDFLCGALCGAWLFRLAYVADIRRAFLGVAILMGLVFYRSRRQLLFVRLFRWMILALTTRRKLRIGVGLGFGFFLILKGILNCLALEYPLFDVGIYHQLLWNISQGNGYLSTVSQAEHFLKDHLVLSLAIFCPLYKLMAGNFWLLGILPGALAGALLALCFGGWWYLVENFPGAHAHRRAWVGAIIVLMAWSFQAFFGNLQWGLHENLAGAALITWSIAIYFAHGQADFKRSSRRKQGAFALSIVLMVLAAGCKETYLLIAAFTCGGLLLSEKMLSRKFVFGALAIAFIATFAWYAQSDRDPGKNYFTRYYGYLGSNLKEMLETLLLHPIKAFHQMPVQSDEHYLFELFVPFGIIPILACFRKLRRNAFGTIKKIDWRWAVALGVLPGFGSALLSTSEMLRNPNLHYFFEVLPVYGFLTILSLFAFAPRKLHLMGISLVLISWLSLWEEPWRDIIPQIKTANANVDVINELKKVPPEASIMTENGVGPWLSARRVASSWSDLTALNGSCPDYFVFVVNPSSPTEKTQKLADIEKVLERCKSVRPKATFIISVGPWQIYSSKS